ncbi:MAG: glycosyltransferase [Reyranella sp.]|jgi:rSAM/selenodomain-associated transferase 1|nr:MAG: glycosyltransferase [Reyranella sp.]
MKRHLVIFARAPQMGRVKRRLAAGIGARAAYDFYVSTLAHQIRTLARDPRWTVWLFVTPDAALGHPAWRGVRVLPQGAGDLGQRMKRPFKILPPGPLVLVGSDIPGLRPHHVARAFALLGRHDLVFGPAADGGFWLFGAQRTKPLPRSLFSNVRWSTSTALADTLAGIPQVSAVLSDTLDDVDDVAAYRRFRLSSSARTVAKTAVQSPGTV